MLLLKTPPTGSTGLPLPGQSEKSSEGLNWKLVCARGCGEDKADCGEEVDDGKGCIYRKSLERERVMDTERPAEQRPDEPPRCIMPCFPIDFL